MPISARGRSPPVLVDNNHVMSTNSKITLYADKLIITSETLLLRYDFSDFQT